MKLKIYKLLPWFSIAIILVPLIVLCFFNHPSADDYSGAEVLKKGEFLFRLKQLYLYWQGRYFSMAFGMFYSYLAISKNIYWLHPLYLFFLTTSGIYFLLSNLLTHFLKIHLSVLPKILISFSLFFLVLYSQPSIAECIYWFSAVSVYHFSIICLLFWSGAFISYYNNTTGKKTFFFILSILTFVICGSNELIAIVLVMLTAIVWLYFYQAKKNMRSISLILLIVIIAALLEIFSPGSIRRSSVISTKDPLKIITATFYWCTQVYLHILKEPLWWLSMFAAILLGARFSKLVRKNIWLHIFIVCFPLLAISPILFGSNGSIPLRMVNSVVSIQVFLLLTEGFLLGALLSNKETIALLGKSFHIKPAYLYIFIAVIIPSSSFTTHLYDNLLQGFFYDKMMTINENLKKTKDPDYNKKVIRSYPEFAINAIKEYPFLNKEIFIQKVQSPPAYIFFYNDFKNEETEKGYINNYFK